MWAGKLPPSSSLPWYQRPTYTGDLSATSSIGGLTFGAPTGQAAASAPQPSAPEIFFCDSCEKEFKVQSQYEAHIATHVTCSHPGCSFQGSQRIVKEHYSETHAGGEGAGAKRLIESLDTPEEIEKWREARRQNWPSNSNIARKQQEQATRAERGDEGVSSGGAKGRKKPRQSWQIVNPSVPQSSGARTQRAETADHSRAGGLGADKSKSDPQPSASQPVAAQPSAAQLSAAESEPLETEVPRAPGLDCLLGYESSDDDDDDDAPPEEVKGVSSKTMEQEDEAMMVETEEAQDQRPELPQKPDAATIRPTAPENRRKRFPCKYFAKGQCRKGDKCPFLHEKPSNPKAQQTEGPNRSAATPGHSAPQTTDYVPYGKVERRGASLLAKLLLKDSEKESRVILQTFRFLVNSGAV